MQDLLFLCHRIPYPPDKGEKIRAFHILRHLAKTHRIHLGCFIDDPADWEHVEVLKALCADTCFVALNPTTAKIRSLLALTSGEALTQRYYRHRGLSAWTRGVLARRRPEAALIYSAAMAQFVLGKAPRPGRLVMDFVDIDSDKWRQYAESRTWPASWIYRRESVALLDLERAIAAATDSSTFVSEAEAEAFRALAPAETARIHAVSNGIDADFFTPAGGYPTPFDDPGPAIVFTGTMNYWPNVDAVQWFARDIFPRIREQIGDAGFHIVGSKPTAEVTRLADEPGIRVTGRVPDVRPYLAHASVAVVPIRIARGIQNKILEAMAMAKPVVTTRLALEGIAATPEAEVLLAEEAPSFADETIRAIRGGARPDLGENARARVIEDFSWPARLATLDALLAG
ncbi:MAG: TIGR03087 family PEP-CTERM/XrtA system glycosyltransferase [Alphaproteobacteria bacterium]|jgi:sugar transferase (PEP-CTERM/EpsH1 system associated)|nr:TIGR03087 family PEP-CTERM/XrtA system glycosyltransferase [Alphaproteobacteria bacterium]MDP6517341.1 TIGR03087 family PEP-CTERM/XrtA system glycosyltransferase [Alphaproteobacteria bacterium]